MTLYLHCGQVEDTKGNNGKSGRLIVTNLRVIWCVCLSVCLCPRNRCQLARPSASAPVCIQTFPSWLSPHQMLLFPLDGVKIKPSAAGLIRS
jgi:hypothetical protein